MSQHTQTSGLANAVLWTGRGLTALIVCFVGFFAVASFVGHADDGSRPLNVGDYAILATFLTSVAGLGLALKWPRFGAVLSLFALLICAMLNWHVLLSPAMLIPITAVLFLLHSWLQNDATRSSTVMT